MGAKEIYDYVSEVAADVDVTLNVSPQSIIWEGGAKAIEIHEGLDGSEERIILSDQSVFRVRLQWRALTEADAGTIFDIYHDTAKACGMATSFKWDHPADGHTYVVRFDSDLSRFRQNAIIYGFATLRLKVLGYIAD
jgi:hypothetical protein